MFSNKTNNNYTSTYVFNRYIKFLLINVILYEHNKTFFLISLFIFEKNTNNFDDFTFQIIMYDFNENEKTIRKFNLLIYDFQNVEFNLFFIR